MAFGHAHLEAGSVATMDRSKRIFLRAAGLLLADKVLPRNLSARGARSTTGSGHKNLLVIFGGVRRQETFSEDGLENIPHLARNLLPQALFYTHVRNEGVTAHFNATASIFTGNWQRVDDWGKLSPTAPTLFEYFRKQLGVPQSEVWVVASNKALTNLIGASSDRRYGPAFSANVVFPKQLLIAAVVNAIREGRSRNLAERDKVQAELETMLQDSNYEGLGWTVFDAANRLDPRVRPTIEGAMSNFVHGGGPTTGDELTFFVSREIMRKFAPTLLVVIFSDVEVAHFGSYSLHLAGIRTVDRLVYQLWQEVEANSEYRGRTTMLVLPEFGRDTDGSTTNGFFNHRSDDESTRTTWMMCLGAAVDRPQVVERLVRHIDLCPTLAALLGCQPVEARGSRLSEIRV
jgi:hypothetical protein